MTCNHPLTARRPFEHAAPLTSAARFARPNRGFLQALVFGFGGLRITAAGLKLRRPSLPDAVGELTLRNLAWRGAQVQLTVRAGSAELALLGGADAVCLEDGAGARQGIAAGAHADLPLDSFPFPALLTLGAC